jgi:F0F1-type ATP synthase assembly protein I
MVAVAQAVEVAFWVALSCIAGREPGWSVGNVYGGLLPFAVRMLAMAASVASIAALAPRAACAFAAGPALGVLAWLVGQLVQCGLTAAPVMRPFWLLGSLPAMFLGASMPLFVRSLSSRRSAPMPRL